MYFSFDDMFKEAQKEAKYAVLKSSSSEGDYDDCASSSTLEDNRVDSFGDITVVSDNLNPDFLGSKTDEDKKILFQIRNPRFEDTAKLIHHTGSKEHHQNTSETSICKQIELQNSFNSLLDLSHEKTSFIENQENNCAILKNPLIDGRPKRFSKGSLCSTHSDIKASSAQDAIVVSEESDAATEVYCEASDESAVGDSSEESCSSDENSTSSSDYFSDDQIKTPKSLQKRFKINKSVDSQCIKRAPKQLGMALEECWTVNGFRDYVDFLAKFKDRNDILHNNHVNAVRSFLSIFDMEGIVPSMKLLTNMDHINKYVRYVHGLVDYVPKTRLLKLEALKKAITWLKMCAFKEGCTYASPADIEPLNAILDVLNHECNLMRPYTKADEGRCSQESSHIATGTYLTREEFAGLGCQIMKELEKNDKLISKYRKSRPEELFKATMEFEQLLLTSLFVMLPTQRSKLFWEAEVSDLTFIPEGASLAIYMEKSSYRRLGIKAAVGRHIFIHKGVAIYLQKWVDQYRAVMASDKQVTSLFVNKIGKPLMSGLVSHWVKSICRRISGANLTPLSIRRLRATYFVESIRELGDSVLEANLVAQYAAEVGQTPEILYQFYLIKKEKDLVNASRIVVDKANTLLFGAKIWDLMTIYPNIQGAPKDEKDEKNGLLQSAHFLPSNNKNNQEHIEDRKMAFHTKNETKPNKFGFVKIKKAKISSGLMDDSSKAIIFIDHPILTKKNTDMPPRYRKLECVDMTTPIGPYVHIHGCTVPLAPFDFEFTKDMKMRISRGNWLNDEVITATLALMRRQFVGIGGLCNTIALASSHIIAKATYCKNIYIVHDSGSHWVTAHYTCDKQFFEVYDSLSSNRVAPNVERQLKRVSIVVDSLICAMPFQRQVGSNDCGVFSIAAAVDLALGIDPCTVNYKQGEMRKHLLVCFKKQHLSPFPRY
jgi:hypothetical protein